MENALATDLSKRTCSDLPPGTPALTPDAMEPYFGSLPNWHPCNNATMLERRFTFPDFITAFRFVEAVASVAEAENHHPDIVFGWGYATIQFQTHSVKGLSDNDFIMAAKVEALPTASA